MHKILSAKYLTVGMIVHHQPRGSFYQLLNRTMIKTEDKDKSWVYGWCYQEVKEVDGKYELVAEAEVYSRPFDLFDSDWLLV